MDLVDFNWTVCEYSCTVSLAGPGYYAGGGDEPGIAGDSEGDVMMVMSPGQPIMKPSQSVTWRLGVRANVTGYSTAEITVSGQSRDCCSLSLYHSLAPAEMLTPFSSASSRIKFWIEHPNVCRGPGFELKRVFGCENCHIQYLSIVYPVSVMMVISLYPMVTEISRRYCSSAQLGSRGNQSTGNINPRCHCTWLHRAACTPL